MGEVFERKSIRMFSDADLEVDQLNQWLEMIDGKIGIPYIERRNASMNSNPIEELAHSIKEITDREKDLKSWVEIAKLLLLKNRNIIDKYNNLSEEHDSVQYEYSLLNKDINEYKSQISEVLAQNEDLSAELSSLKYDHELVRQESAQLKFDIEQMKKAETPGGKIEIDGLRTSYTNKMLSLNQRIEISDQKLRKKKEALQCMEAELAKEREQSRTANSRVRQLQQQIEVAEAQIYKAKSSKKESQEKVTALQFELKSAHRISERLKLELARSSHKPSRPPRHTKAQSIVDYIDSPSPPRKGKNLFMELEETNETFDSQIFKGSSDSKKSAFICLTPTGQSSPQKKAQVAFENMRVHALVVSGVIVHDNLTPGNLLQMSIDANWEEVKKEKENSFNPERKNVVEEYFGLVCLSAKLNSPYMDSVCTISNKDLHNEAMSRNIPFHQWHSFVDVYLTEQYINNMYKTKEVEQDQSLIS